MYFKRFNTGGPVGEYGFNYVGRFTRDVPGVVPAPWARCPVFYTATAYTKGFKPG
jgi:hypothetical protein